MNPTQIGIAGAAAGLIVGFAIGRLSASAKKSKKPAKKRAPKATKASAPRKPSGKRAGEGIELYVGNLPYEAEEPDLVKAFSVAGEALSARVIRNKFNNKSKGYGFVEMATEADAKKAAAKMNGVELQGRKIVVNEARSRSRD